MKKPTEQMTFDNPKIWYDYVTKKYFLGEIGTFNKLIKTVRDLGVYKYDRKTGFYKVPFETDIGVNVMDFSYDPTDYEPLDPFIKSVMREIGGKVVYAIDYPEDYLSCDEFMHIINDMERIQEFPPFDFDSEEKFAYVIKDVPEESTSKAAENVEKIEKYEQNHQELISPEPITDVKDVTRESLLDGAKKCVCSDRNKQYGSPEDNFGIIARYWKEYLGTDITAMDVGIMMTLFKIGRMQSGGYKPDNFIDAIGYLACAGEQANRRTGECGAKEEES